MSALHYVNKTLNGRITTNFGTVQAAILKINTTTSLYQFELICSLSFSSTVHNIQFTE